MYEGFPIATFTGGDIPSMLGLILFHHPSNLAPNPVVRSRRPGPDLGLSVTRKELKESSRPSCFLGFHQRHQVKMVLNMLGISPKNSGVRLLPAAHLTQPWKNTVAYVSLSLVIFHSPQFGTWGMESRKTCFPSGNTFKQTKYIYLVMWELRAAMDESTGICFWFIAGTMGFDTHRHGMT